MDALAKLVYVLVKVAEGAPAKVALFNKLLAIFARCLLRDADAHGAGSSAETVTAMNPLPNPEQALRFDQRPYLRLFTNLLRDMHQAPPPAAPPGADDATVAQVAAATNDAIAFNSQILASFANVLHAVRPERVPGFAFSWLEITCHRLFFPALLGVPGQRGWPLAHRLILDLFRFLYPALRRAEMNTGVKLLYRGGLRLLLVLHHDAPEFLADYHASLLDVLPPSCIQLRNLLLSAAPRGVRLPDPFVASGHIDSIPESTVVPRLLGNPGDNIPANALPLPLKNELDAFLRSGVTRAGIAPSMGVTALSNSPLGQALRNVLFASPEETAFTLSRYSASAIQALVLHLADVTLGKIAEDVASNPALQASIPRGTLPASLIVGAAHSSAAVDVLNFLLGEADAEGRYAILNAIVNQLRFPNAHTLFFSQALLRGVFMQGLPLYPAGTTPPPPASIQGGALPPAIAEVVREQLTRVMLERVIVHRPHPWGLLVTFIELIRNVGYAFWSHPFTRLNPDVEKLFESVARSCMGPAATAAASAGTGGVAAAAPAGAGASAPVAAGSQ